jgi:serine/threonine protein kinase
MEYMPKGNLTSLVQWYWQNKRETISEVWMATYIFAVLRGLEYLHKNGIVHGDIKGENVLFGSNCMKLVDFGASKDSNVSELSLVPKGTKCYMAPEVESKVEATYASDMFPLAVFSWRWLQVLSHLRRVRYIS